MYNDIIIYMDIQLSKEEKQQLLSLRIKELALLEYYANLQILERDLDLSPNPNVFEILKKQVKEAKSKKEALINELNSLDTKGGII